MSGRGGARGLLLCAGAFLTACASTSGYRDGLAGRLLGGIDNGQHDGPMVSVGGTGTARFAEALVSEFDAKSVLESSSVLGGEDSARLSAQIVAGLEELGFGSDPRLELRIDEAGGSGEVGRVAATVLGHSTPDQQVVLLSPLRSLAARALLEGGRALLASFTSGAVEWPARSITLIWAPAVGADAGTPMPAPRATIALLVLDASPALASETALALQLERAPDPGALSALGPDQLPAGAQPVLNASDLSPNGLAIIARSAIVDVGVGRGKEWRTLEHPFAGEGERFSEAPFEREVPTASFRLTVEVGDEPEDFRLSSCALFVAALAVADPTPLDFDRYLKTLSLERRLRVHYAREAEDEELEDHWNAWFIGARHWLRRLCHGLPMP